MFILFVIGFLIVLTLVYIGVNYVLRQKRMIMILEKSLDERDKYVGYLIKQYESCWKEKTYLQQTVEFFERELGAQEDEKNAECRVQNAE